MSTSPSSRRTLVLLRHAKSDWPDVPDHERPLAERGRRDAPAMGRRLREAGLVPDGVLVSSARRTRETWRLVSEQLGGEPSVVVEDRVYSAAPGAVLQLIRRVEPSWRTVLVVGHDPAVSELARTLPGESADPAFLVRMRLKFPTAAVAVLEFNGIWGELEPGAARLTAFVTPRELRDKKHTGG
jgi:phosphohistidine phosphatase